MGGPGYVTCSFINNFRGTKICSLPTAPSGGLYGDHSGQATLSSGNNETDKYQMSPLLSSVIMKGKRLFCQIVS